MKFYVLYILQLVVSIAFGQSPLYTTGNAHSHNDYEQPHPFGVAYGNGFGSIEADVFLRDNNLFVAHASKEIKAELTLKNLYLDPLLKCVRKNGGYAYKNHLKKLMLLIDCKTEGKPTVREIINELKAYPDLLQCKNLIFVITGNLPNKDSLFQYPSFIWFDGNLNYQYTQKNREKIALFSADFKNYSQWNGEGVIDSVSKSKLNSAINKVHAAKKPVRFWDAPDNKSAWLTFILLGIDYMNTDKIDELSNFLNSGN